MEPIDLIFKLTSMNDFPVREKIDYNKEEAKTTLIDDNGNIFEIVVKKIGEQEQFL